MFPGMYMVYNRVHIGFRKEASLKVTYEMLTCVSRAEFW